jgi:hypothetical protein
MEVKDTYSICKDQGEYKRSAVSHFSRLRAHICSLDQFEVLLDSEVQEGLKGQGAVFQFLEMLQQSLGMKGR